MLEIHDTLQKAEVPAQGERSGLASWGAIWSALVTFATEPSGEGEEAKEKVVEMARSRGVGKDSTRLY
jgi:hypothetical protein